MNDPLYRLIYVSTALLSSHEDVRDILNVSCEKNEISSVTGILVYDYHFFAQVLEGGRREVCETFIRISQDKRHHDVNIICADEIDSRLFGSWSMMGIENFQSAGVDLQKYSPFREFTPYSVSSKTILELLLAIYEANRQSDQHMTCANFAPRPALNAL